MVVSKNYNTPEPPMVVITSTELGIVYAFYATLIAAIMKKTIRRLCTSCRAAVAVIVLVVLVAGSLMFLRQEGKSMTPTMTAQTRKQETRSIETKDNYSRDDHGGANAYENGVPITNTTTNANTTSNTKKYNASLFENRPPPQQDTQQDFKFDIHNYRLCRIQPAPSKARSQC